MNNIKCNRYIYHYHVFENVVENSDNYDLSKIMELLPVVAFGKFKRKNEMNFGKITENHQLFQNKIN